MSQKNPLESAALQKRSDELDARERFLDSQQKLIDEGPTKVKVLEATISAKTEQLEALESDISTTKSELVLAEDTTQKEIADINKRKQRSLEEYKDLELSLKEKRSSIEADIQRLNGELKSLNISIDDRKHYSISQEKDINEAISSGNEYITSLKRSSDDLSEHIDELKYNRVELEINIADLSTIKSNLTEDMTYLSQEYDHKRNMYESSIQEIITQLKELTEEKHALEINQEKYLQDIKARELSVQAKIDSLRLETQEFHEEKRRYERGML